MEAADAANKQTDARTGEGLLGAAVRVVSGLTLLSRVFGLVRDVVTARLFGEGLLGSAFRAAYALPNVFRRLFGEGALSAAFLPEYALLRRDDLARAGALASAVVWFVTLATGVLTLVGEVAIFARLLFPAGDELALSLRLIMLMLPMMPAVCLAAILAGVLQAHGKFGVPAAAPVLLNVFQIITGGVFLWMGVGGAQSGGSLRAAYAVGLSAIAASVLTVAWSWWALRGKVAWTMVFASARESTGKVRSRFLPALLGLGTLQLNTMLDTLIAMWPVWVGATMFGRTTPLDEKSNAILSYTQTLYQFPLGVFGIAVATAIFPLLARTQDRPGEFLDHLRRGVRLSLFIGVPASIGLFLVRHDLVGVVFGGGRRGFTGDGLGRCALVLAGFSPAVWVYALNHVLTRAFYARGDTKTPMRVAMACVALNFALNMVLIWRLREAGLAWATGISACVQCVSLHVLLSRTQRTVMWDRATILGTARFVALSIAMGMVVWSVGRVFGREGSWSSSLVRLASCVGTGGAVYLLGAWMLRCPELRWLVTRAPRGDGSVEGLTLE
jgi:putative peptidoglycan lipid II flippase